MSHATRNPLSVESKKSLWLTVLISMVGFSCVFPAFAQYLFSFILLVWIVVGKRWRDLPEVSFSRPIHWGVLAYLTAMGIAGILAGVFSPFVDGFSDVLRSLVHFALKSGLVWIVLFCGFVVILKNNSKHSKFFRLLAILLFINFCYLIAQRYTGINWSSGLSAVLPPNRYAYGVYRVSGFMGHPLSLSFSLVTLVLTFAGLRLDRGLQWDRKELRLLNFLLGITTASLLVTGSRWPLIVVILSVSFAEGVRIRRWAKQIALGIVAFSGFLFWEKSIIGRFSEVIFGSEPLEVRFERLVFWKVHFNMFMDNPLYGVGMGASDRAKLHYYNALGYNETIYNAHNVYLQTLADSGLVGFFGFLIFLSGIGLAIGRMGSVGGVVALRYVFASILLGALMQNTMRDSEYIFSVWFSLALIFAFAVSRSVAQKKAAAQ